jgi:hypothetical protein
MSKKIDFPQASFEKALKLAEAIDSLGGSCSSEIAGNKIGSSGTSGGFKTLTGATVKFNLIRNEKGTLSNTDLFKAINLSYNEQEKTKNLRIAFLTPSIFNQLYEKLKGRELPIDILDKMLIKEYDVDADAASRVSKYFISGAKKVGLINEKNILISNLNDEKQNGVIIIEEDSSNKNIETQLMSTSINEQIILSDRYIIQIIGPGLNTRIEINEIEDLEIVNITLNKIKRKLS